MNSRAKTIAYLLATPSYKNNRTLGVEEEIRTRGLTGMVFDEFTLESELENANAVRDETDFSSRSSGNTPFGPKTPMARLGGPTVCS